MLTVFGKKHEKGESILQMSKYVKLHYYKKSLFQFSHKTVTNTSMTENKYLRKIFAILKNSGTT